MPKIVDHECRREEVARATWQVIAKRGIEAATMREIAKEARCSTGILVHYFEDKDEMLLYALRLAAAHEAGRMAKRKQQASGHEALRNVLQEALPLDKERRLEWQIWVNFWSRATANVSMSEEQKRWYEEYRNGVRDILLDGQRSGVFREDMNASQEADAVVAFVDGIGMHATQEPRRFPPKYQVAMLDRYLSNLLRR